MHVEEEGARRSAEAADFKRDVQARGVAVQPRGSDVQRRLRSESTTNAENGKLIAAPVPASLVSTSL